MPTTSSSTTAASRTPSMRTPACGTEAPPPTRTPRTRTAGRQAKDSKDIITCIPLTAPPSISNFTVVTIFGIRCIMMIKSIRTSMKPPVTKAAAWPNGNATGLKEAEREYEKAVKAGALAENDPLKFAPILLDTMSTEMTLRPIGPHGSTIAPSCFGALPMTVAVEMENCEDKISPSGTPSPEEAIGLLNVLRKPHNAGKKSGRHLPREDAVHMADRQTAVCECGQLDQALIMA